MTAAFEAAEIVLPCAELDPTVRFFTGTLGFRLELIEPADAPAAAVIAGHGLRLRLEPGDGDPGLLRLSFREPVAVAGGATTLIAPNGTRIELVPAEVSPVIGPLEPSLVVSRGGASSFAPGRAGMLYRDLIPGRQGGRFIASHIRIEEGGPVPDSVHFHRVALQLIYCRAGSVEVVYEDQGPPFALEPGDCVLQPPGIRHRVLSCSPGMEVVELACPASHPTFLDHDLALPTAARRPDRRWNGQRFVRHLAAVATWEPWDQAGFEARDTGVGAASGGRVGARVVRAVEPAPADLIHEGELRFLFVCRGALTLRPEGGGELELGVDDAVTVPPRLSCVVSGGSSDLEFLEIAVPGGR